VIPRSFSIRVVRPAPARASSRPRAPGDLEDPVRERRFPVVDVGDDREVANVRGVGHGCRARRRRRAARGRHSSDSSGQRDRATAANPSPVAPRVTAEAAKATMTALSPVRAGSGRRTSTPASDPTRSAARGGASWPPRPGDGQGDEPVFEKDARACPPAAPRRLTGSPRGDRGGTAPPLAPRPSGSRPESRSAAGDRAPRDGRGPPS